MFTCKWGNIHYSLYLEKVAMWIGILTYEVKKKTKKKTTFKLIYEVNI